METAQDHLTAAERELRDGHAHAALDEAQAALRTQPESGQAHALMGLAHILMGEEDDGRRLLTRAAELTPLDSRVRYLAYLGLGRLRDAAGARVQLTYFVDLESKNAQARELLAKLGGPVPNLPPLARPVAVHWYDGGGQALTDAGDLEDEREGSEPPPGPGVLVCPACQKRTWKGICCAHCGEGLLGA